MDLVAVIVRGAGDTVVPGPLRLCVPIEVKTTIEDRMHVANTSQTKIQYDAFEASHLQPVYALRRIGLRGEDPWRFFLWPRRPEPGRYPILRWSDGLTWEQLDSKIP